MKASKLIVDQIVDSSGVSPALSPVQNNPNNFSSRQTLSFGMPLKSTPVVALGIDGNAFHIAKGSVSVIKGFTNITGSGPFLLITDDVLTFKHITGVLETTSGADIVTKPGYRLRLEQDANNVTWLITPLSSLPKINAPIITPPKVSIMDVLVADAYSTISNYYGTHAASDWETATDINFTNIVDNSINDTINLTTYRPLNLLTSTKYYSRVRYRSMDFIGNWSPVVQYVTPAASIKTPVVTYSGGGVIVGSPFTVVGGSDTHVSTDWVVKDTSGVIIYSSLADIVNLTTYTVPYGVLKPTTTYTFEVIYHGAKLPASGTGVALVTTNIMAIFGSRGVIAGGNNGIGATVATIDYITIATLGNAVNFGNLTVGRYGSTGVSDGSRGVIAGGINVAGGAVATIDYITIATLGNAVNFGNLTVGRYGSAGVSDRSRGVIAGGITFATVATIDYITIATLGNAVNFGNLTVGRYGSAGVSDGSRGVIAGAGGAVATIDYITISTLGNAVNFGNLTVGRYYATGVSDGSRGVIAGGVNVAGGAVATIDYITIATLGNAVNFGNLTVGRYYATGVSDGSRGVIAGGYTATTTIDYITISTLGNAVNFGNLTVGRYIAAGVSGS